MGLGAGGAAKAVVLKLMAHGAEVTVCNRTEEKARLLHRYRPKQIRTAGFTPAQLRRAAEAGDERAAKLVRKGELDYIREGLESRSAGELYERMKAFSALAYPGDAPDARAARELSQLGQHHYNRRDYAAALKLLRAAAEFGCDGEAQNCLGLIYNAGAGVRRSDLVSLYWFDRAADSGVQAARRDRDGILNAYRATLSPEEFTDYMQRVARWCENGGPEVPRTPQKAAFWRRIAASK